MANNIVDPVETLTQIIDNDYTLGNVANSAKPLILNKNQKQRRFNTANKPGLILLYMPSDNISHNGYGARKRHDRFPRVSIEVKRFKTREYLMSNVREVRRIIENRASSVGDYSMDSSGITGTYSNPFQLMWEVSAKDLSNMSSKSPFKYLIDVEMEIIGQVKATS